METHRIIVIKIGISITFLFMFVTALLQAQVLHPLAPNEYSIGVGFGFQEGSTTLSSHIDYGISHTIKGSFEAGLEFTEDSFPGTSIPPAPLFGIGFLSVNPLLQTGLDYFVTGNGFVEFAKILDQDTEDTLVTMRWLSLGGGLGLAKRIKMQSGFIVAPFAQFSYGKSWLTTDIDLLGYSETEGDSGFRVASRLV